MGGCVGAAPASLPERGPSERSRRHRDVHLTPTEYQLLKVFIAHPNKVLTDRMLLQSVWGPEYGHQVEYLRTFINQLRKKIEPDPAHPRYLLTEPWVGYRFKASDQ